MLYFVRPTVRHDTLDTVHLTLHGTASAELEETGEELNELFHQALLVFESPADTNVFFRTLRRTLQSAGRPEQSEAMSAFLEGIVSVEEASNHQQGMKLVAEGVARDFKRRKQVLADTWGVEDVVNALDLKRQSVNERWKKGKLFGFLSHGSVRFPIWQFDPEGEKGVLQGQDKVIAALAQSQLSTLNQIYWMTSRKPQFDGHTPVEALKAGRVDEVTSWALSAGVM